MVLQLLKKLIAYWERNKKHQISIKDQVVLVKKLHVLLNAGMGISDAFRMMAQQQTKVRKNIFLEISTKLSYGQTLTATLNANGVALNAFLKKGIEVGETTGTLSQCLESCAITLDKIHILKKKMLGAMIYPGCVLICALGMMILVLCFVFPQILPVLNSLDVPLPFLTKVLIFVSDIVNDYGIHILVGAIIFAGLTKVVINKSNVIKRGIEHYAYALPLVGNMIKTYRAGVLCRMISFQLSNGISHEQSWKTASGHLKSVLLSEIYLDISMKLFVGESIFNVQQSYSRYFPGIFFELLSVGEKTGTLDAMYTNVAEICENELDDTLKKITSLLEPALMLCLGLGIGATALSILMPIYEVTQHIH